MSIPWVMEMASRHDLPHRIVCGSIQRGCGDLFDWHVVEIESIESTIHLV